MDILAWCLGGFVVLYAGVYSSKMLSWLIGYKGALRNGELKEYNGEVSGKTGEENKAIGKSMINICYPIYKCVVGEKEHFHQSIAKYRDVNIGQEITMSINIKTGEMWAMRDLPIIKKQLTSRLIMIGILLVLLILESVLL